MFKEVSSIEYIISIFKIFALDDEDDDDEEDEEEYENTRLKDRGSVSNRMNQNPKNITFIHESRIKE